MATLAQAKQQFIEAWGGHGSAWGINRTMAQIHALLLVSEVALSTEDVMGALEISRGNANMNLRALVEWNLISRTAVKGDRREYFMAEKDAWRIATQIARERRKREIEPMLKTLEGLSAMEIRGEEKRNAEAFRQTIKNLREVTLKADQVISVVAKAGGLAVTKKILKLFVK
jgi:DNA-binding transcriptional regulator GbsR (MarR family)